MRIILFGLILFVVFLGFLGRAIPLEDVSHHMYSSLLSAANRLPASSATKHRSSVSDSGDLKKRLSDLHYVRQQIATLEENIDKISQKNRDYFENILSNYRYDELILSQQLKQEDIRAYQAEERSRSNQQRRQDMNELLASNKQRSRDQQEQFYRNLELQQARMANQLQRINDMREHSPMTLQRN